MIFRTRKKIVALRNENIRLMDALNIIAGGLIDRFPGAPPIDNSITDANFRSKMWSWSQKVAKDALANR